MDGGRNKANITIKSVTPCSPSSVTISFTTNKQEVTSANHWPYGEQEPRLVPRTHCKYNLQADYESRDEPPKGETSSYEKYKEFKF